MTVDSTRLLQMLEPAVRPSYAPAAPRAGLRAPLEMRSFDELLEEAKAGQVPSGRAVRVDFQPAEPISQDQLRRLEDGADFAEASGARSAVLLSEGRGLLLDVAARTITGELSAAQRASRLDAAVYIPPAEIAAQRPFGPPGGVPPRGI